MKEELIEAVDSWFEKNSDSETYHNGNEYCISRYDIDDFLDMLADFPDLIGINCIAQEKIWFFREDLENVQFY